MDAAIASARAWPGMEHRKEAAGSPERKAASPATVKWIGEVLIRPVDGME